MEKQTKTALKTKNEEQTIGSIDGLFFNWSIVNLQYCANLHHTAVIQLYTHWVCVQLCVYSYIYIKLCMIYTRISCYTVGPCWLSFPSVTVCISQPQPLVRLSASPPRQPVVFRMLLRHINVMSFALELQSRILTWSRFSATAVTCFCFGLVTICVIVS